MVGVFRPGGVRPPVHVMVSFIDDHRDAYGVEPICAELPIASSTYYEQKAREADPSPLPPRVRRDSVLEGEIRRVWEDNFRVYGVRKVWRQFNREHIPIAKCTTERLMRKLAIQGVVRGRSCRTTVPDNDAARRIDSLKPSESREILLRRVSRNPVVTKTISLITYIS